MFPGLGRAATVYAAHKGRIAQKPRAMQVYLKVPWRDSICGPQGPNYAETESKENELVRFSLPRCYRICGRRPNCAEAESNASLLAIASGATAYAAALSLAVMLAVDFSVICTAHAISFLIKKRDLVSLYP